jgi:hypothetical protein
VSHNEEERTVVSNAASRDRSSNIVRSNACGQLVRTGGIEVNGLLCTGTHPALADESLASAQDTMCSRECPRPTNKHLQLRARETIQKFKKAAACLL